jgi:hypothetical protein
LLLAQAAVPKTAASKIATFARLRRDTDIMPTSSWDERHVGD